MILPLGCHLVGELNTHTEQLPACRGFDNAILKILMGFSQRVAVTARSANFPASEVLANPISKRIGSTNKPPHLVAVNQGFIRVSNLGLPQLGDVHDVASATRTADTVRHRGVGQPNLAGNLRSRAFSPR